MRTVVTLSEAESLDAFLPESPPPTPPAKIPSEAAQRTPRANSSAVSLDDVLTRETLAPPAKLPSEPAQRAPRVNSSAVLRAVSLDDVLTRETPVQWDEAVAVVQELCDLLTIAGGDEPPVPELAAILITANGQVKLKPGARGERDVTSAGRILHALLSSATTPVPLRLFITQSVSPGTYASIREFAAALAYFGKPGRAELIRALYERCAAKGASASATTSTRSTRPPDPAASKKPESKSVCPRKRRIPVWSALVATAACLLGAGLWFWSTAASSPTAVSPVPALISGAKSAIQKLATEVRNSVGAGTAPANSAMEQTAASPPVVPPRRRVVSPRLADSPQSPTIPLDGIQLAPPTVAQVQQPAPVAALVEQPSVDPPASPVDAVVEADGLQAIYSSADLEVQPPILLYPQLPSPLMIGSSPEALNRMELIVSENGIVEHVRLVDGPRRLPDMMLLSGAKLWRFEPAVKDGARVRYRTVLSWFGVP